MAAPNERSGPGVPPESEREWGRTVYRYAIAGGWSLRYHTHDSRHNSHGTVPGFPDWVLGHERKGLMIVVELKSDEGKTRPDQDAWLELWMRAGVPAYVWRPVDEPEVLDVLVGTRARKDRDQLWAQLRDVRRHA